MTSHLFTGISELRLVDPNDAVHHDAALIADDGRVAWVGAAASAPAADTSIDLEGRAVLPGWVDSHTHLVFAGDRTTEFEERMAGRTYTAGGIVATTSATQAASDDTLRTLVRARTAAARRGGTTTLETKTGYGLSVDEEARHARIAAEYADAVTFLGAHLVPAGRDIDSYTAEVAGPMLTAVRAHVGWIDVFVERGAFDEEHARMVLAAGASAGLGLRVHGNQLGPGPGVRLAVEVGAASVDHVNFVSNDDVEALSGSWRHGTTTAPGGQRGTVATVLPACDLSTRMPLAPARRLLDSGIPVAIASNLNPGTSYTSSMNFCVGTAVLQQQLSVAEAVRSATYYGALSLRMEADVGSLEVGKRANLHVLDAPSAVHLAYRIGMPMTYATYVDGLPSEAGPDYDRLR